MQQLVLNGICWRLAVEFMNGKVRAVTFSPLWLAFYLHLIHQSMRAWQAKVGQWVNVTCAASVTWLTVFLLFYSSFISVMSGLIQRVSDWNKMGEIWDFFRSDCSTICLWKSPEFVPFRSNLTQIGAKPKIPDNLSHHLVHSWFAGALVWYQIVLKLNLKIPDFFHVDLDTWCM